jgi:hypothetical protein
VIGLTGRIKSGAKPVIGLVGRIFKLPACQPTVLAADLDLP